MTVIITRLFARVVGIRNTPVAGDHMAGRGGLRYRRIALTAAAGILQKVVSVSTGLISVPLVLRYLGTEQFGIWMAFMGFVSLLQFTDLGLGIGLQNRLTECDGADDRVKPQRLISSTLLVMVSTATVLILVGLFVIPAMPLGHFVRTVTDAARGELLPSARMFVIAFAVVLPLGLVQYVCNAYQRGYLTSGCLSAANLLAFAGALIGIGGRLPLWWFVFVATVAPAPVYLAVGTAILSRKPWLRPTFRAISLHELHRVMKLGLPGFGAQTGANLMLQGPTLVISSVFGAAAVGPFALAQQLLSVAHLALNVIIVPLWPAYGEAVGRGDVAWIKHTFVRSLWISLVIVSATFIMVAFFGRTVIRLWTGRPDIVPTLSLLLACNAWAVVSAWNRACSMLLNGLGRMTGQAIYGVALPAIAVVLALHLGPTVGVAGVVWLIMIFGDTLRAAFLGGEVFVVMHTLNKLATDGSRQGLQVSRADYLSAWSAVARVIRSGRTEEVRTELL